MERAVWPQRLSLPPAGWRTRFAPAPTGRLHLGHAVNAVVVWGLARAGGGRVVLRIEDHDRVRCRSHFERELLDDLDWLGLEAEEGSTASFRSGPHPLRQSDNGPRYAAMLDRLAAQDLVYPCDCSRRRIRSLQAPAGGSDGDPELVYPGTCRARRLPPDSTAMRRVRLPEGTVEAEDLRLGRLSQDPARQCGDLLACDRDGHWTYQFAVVVDDLEQGIDLVIRGEDLLTSTGRQVALARLLGRATPPCFLHHPLVRRPDGAKLSKSNRDTGLADLRAAGWSPGRVLGTAAHLAGLQETPRPLAPGDLADLFARRIAP